MSAPDDRRWGQPAGPLAEPERDVDAEIAFHIEARIEDNLRRGLGPEEARAEAETRFGSVAPVRRDLLTLAQHKRRRRRRRDVLLDFGRDVRLAARGLIRRPAFTAIAVLTLALGIGGNTAVFGLVDTLVLQPPPGIERPESLARVWFVLETGRASLGEATAIISHPHYLDLAHPMPAVASLAAVTRTTVHVALPDGDDPRPRRLTAEMATGNFASTLGIRARIGRLPGPEDAADPRVTAISERLWRQLFAKSPAAVGSTLLLNGASYTVIGVVAGGYHGSSIAEDTDLLVPVEAYADAGASFIMASRGSPQLLSDRRIGLWNSVIARLSPGWTAEEAQAQLRPAWDRALEANPIMAPGPFGHPVPTVRAGVGLASIGPNMAKLTNMLALLSGVVAFLLLLACANAANLLLVRAAARRGELAVMRALGAGRGQLVRQMLLEALLLAFAGAAVGVGVAFGAIGLFRGERLLSWLPPLATVDLSGTVLLFSFALSLLAAVLCGVLPAVLAVRNLGWISSGASGPQLRTRTTRGLLVFQVAVSFVLVVGAGLLLDTLRALRSTPLGVDPERVLEASIDPSTQHYDEAAAARLYRDVLAAASALPSVSVAALARWPVLGVGRGGARARPEGTDREDPRALSGLTNVVSPGFLAAVGLDLIEGRDFRADEMYAAPGTQGVAILSAAAASHLFPEGGAVGRRIDMGSTTPRILEVVGVIGDARLLSVKEGEGAWVLEPLGQRPSQWATLYLRGRGAAPTQREVEAMMTRVDPAIPLYDVQPLSRRVDQNLSVERVLARATGLFAALALLLAGVGIYAVTATAVHGRTRELGVRLALGADIDTVRAMVLREGLVVAVLGVLVGALASTQLVGVLAKRLWGVEPLDPTVFMVSAGMLLVAAALACWMPAWRATRIDPVTALRAE